MRLPHFLLSRLRKFANAIQAIKFKKKIYFCINFRTSDEQEEEHGNVEKSYLVKYCNLYVTQPHSVIFICLIFPHSNNFDFLQSKNQWKHRSSGCGR